MSTFKDQLTAVPQTLGLVGRFLSLLGQSNDPMVFLFACREGDFSRAFATIDKPDEQIHEEITQLRETATTVADENPELIAALYDDRHE